MGYSRGWATSVNYHLQALILGFLLIASGALVLVYVAFQPGTNSSSVRESIVVFTGLGLVLIGSLVTFVAPETLVAAELVSRASMPSAKNQALVFASLPGNERGIHVPRVVLGGESQVFLVVMKIGEKSSLIAERDASALKLDWTGTRKVLEPVGLDLMRGYERAIKRDFFGLDIEQLGRLLSRAIVPEFQLCSGFSLSELSPSFVETTWTKPVVLHACGEQPGKNYPELCYLCSSVACAIAKATGRLISIEKSDYSDAGSRVVTTYRILGE